MSENKLFSEFPPISKEAWEQQIKEDLKGADYEKKLVWKTIDGFSVQPYYMAQDVDSFISSNLPNESPFLRGYKEQCNDWQIIQQIDCTDPITANKFAQKAVCNGANALSFKLDFLEKDLSVLLSNIDISKCPIHFHSIHSYGVLAEALKNFISDKKLNASELTGSFNFDSFGYYLLHGKYYNSHDDNMNELKCLIDNISKSLPNYRIININAQHFSNAGSSVTQELGFAIASSHEYLQEMLSRGLKVEKVLPKMRLTLSVGPSYFFEIAKFRAARVLWANVVAQYTNNTDLQKIRIHGISSLYNKTLYDLFNNMLRNTTEAMSASLGGADEITILPHDFLLGSQNEFGDRISRNVQLLLKEESNFGMVADPTAGSYYIETLTQSVAEFAWKNFQMVEENGGFRAAMEKGLIKAEIEKTVAKRDKDIASRKMVYVGINNYPNTKEQFAEADRFLKQDDVAGNALKMRRGALNFEKIRMQTDSYVYAGNNRPKITMLQFGNLAMRNARAIFATNFFGMAGYEISSVVNDASIKEGVDKALAESPGVVVLCSSDDEYPTLGLEYMNELKSRNVTFVLAGNPGENEALYKESGVHSFVHVRTLALEALEEYQKVLSVH